MMDVRFFDTRSRKKRVFVPCSQERVGLYVCGPTVYDSPHIGNARAVVVFDVLFRFLRWKYGAERVWYVRNITDVDDKIIARARREGVSEESLTTRVIRDFQRDMEALGALPPTREPRASGHIEAMVAMIERLLEKGAAYRAQGHVLFSVSSYPEYGRLSGCRREEMLAGARVEVAPYKRDPADFVLWKPGRREDLGWESPWGYGRPGWHIECSAMSQWYLGRHFDIHGGGRDLVFPHHENEIAQSESCYGQGFVNFWMHNGHVLVDGRKMSKSFGNVWRVRDLLRVFPGEAIRLALLTAQYRCPLDITLACLSEAQRKLDRWYDVLRRFPSGRDRPRASAPDGVLKALANDLDFPQVLSALDSLRHRANATKNPDISADLQTGGRLLGLLQKDPVLWFQDAKRAESRKESAIGRSPEDTQALGTVLQESIMEMKRALRRRKEVEKKMMRIVAAEFKDVRRMVSRQELQGDTHIRERLMKCDDLIKKLRAILRKVEDLVQEILLKSEDLIKGYEFYVGETASSTMPALYEKRVSDFEKFARSWDCPSEEYTELLKQSLETIEQFAVEMVAVREQRRKTRKWERADRIRDALQGLGIQINDTSEGSEWRYSAVSLCRGKSFSRKE